ncbi:MAG: hypothetical protein ACRENB_13225 [Gemmatimonadales bacterium]
MRFVPALVALLALSATATAGQAQQPAPAPAPPPPLPSCDSAAFRAFDFWIGEWGVTVSGRPAGRNVITLEEKGCLIHEHWTGARGGTGQSFNFYDRQDGKWHQVWVSSTGAVLRLSGGREGDEMRLAGETTTAVGITRHRLTFTKNADGTVRQFWESSSDGGKTWAVAFDGLYRKAP